MRLTPFSLRERPSRAKSPAAHDARGCEHKALPVPILVGPRHLMKSSSTPPPVLTMQSTSLHNASMSCDGVARVERRRRTCAGRENEQLLSDRWANNYVSAAGAAKHGVCQRARAARVTRPADDVRRVPQENCALDLREGERGGERQLQHPPTCFLASWSTLPSTSFSSSATGSSLRRQ